MLCSLDQPSKETMHTQIVMYQILRVPLYANGKGVFSQLNRFYDSIGGSCGHFQVAR